MSLDKEIIRRCLGARESLARFIQRVLADLDEIHADADAIASQVLLQFLILLEMSTLESDSRNQVSFSAPNTDRSFLKASSELSSLQVIFEQFFLSWLDIEMEELSRWGIPFQARELDQLLEHPLIILEPETIKLLSTLLDETFIPHSPRSTHSQGRIKSLATVFVSLKNELSEHVSEELIGEIGEHLLVPDERKRTGVFYTPFELTTYMTRKVIDTWISSKLQQGRDFQVGEDLATILPRLNEEQLAFLMHELLNARILDPAMGSGHFLVACARHVHFVLMKVLERLQELTTTDALMTMELRTNCCTITDEESLLHHVYFHMIHGVDLSALAVNLARARLFLAWRERAKKRLETVHVRTLQLVNLKLGNSLLGFVRSPKKSISLKSTDSNLEQVDRDYWDDLYLGTILEKANVQGSFTMKNHFFHWFLEFSGVFPSADTNSEGFDIIISNPPYLSFKSSKTSKKSEHPNLLRHVYGKIQDVYECFIQRTDHLLSDTGMACLIIPNNILSKMPSNLEKKIIVLENIGERIFPNAPMTAVTIILWSKKRVLVRKIAFKNLIDEPNKLTRLQAIPSVLIPSLRWSRQHPLVQKLETLDLRVRDLGIKVTRGEELGKKALIKSRSSKSDELIPIFTASNMRFYGLDAPSHYINPLLIKKQFYGQPKVGFSISFRNRIKCSYLGTNVTLKSIICLHHVPREWMWWLLLTYNSSIFDFYHRCVISWYQEKRTNTIAEIREFPIFSPVPRNLVGLNNLVQLLVISHDLMLHRVLDLALVEHFLIDLDADGDENAHVLMNFLNTLGKNIVVPTELLDTYPPLLEKDRLQEALKIVRKHVSVSKKNIQKFLSSSKAKEWINYLERTEKDVLTLNYRLKD